MDNENVSVPYVVFEGEMARAERHIKRLWIALLVAIAMLFLSNALWLYEWCQYDYVVESESTVYQQDGEGLNIIGNGNNTDAEFNFHGSGFDK